MTSSMPLYPLLVLEVGSGPQVPTFRNLTYLDLQVGLVRDLGARHNKLVRTHSAHFQCWDKSRATLDSLDSPRLGLGRSHHLPPYSILCSSPPHLHPNGSFSRDSQSGVPKLFRFGLLGLWVFITSCLELELGRGLNQSCSSPQELSNSVSHSTCTHRDRVDSRLLVVGVKLPIWLPTLLSTVTYTIDVQMAHARPFWTFSLQDLSNGIKNASMQGVLTPTITL